MMLEDEQGKEHVVNIGPSEEGSECGDFKYFRVKLEREKGIFGFAYRADRHGLCVTAIIKGSSIDTWNHQTDSGRKVCVGDLITGVNDVVAKQGAKDADDAGCEKLVEELASREGVCSLTVCRNGPRWHLEGIVARSMELIELQAVDMELVEVDDVVLQEDELIKDSERANVKWPQFWWLTLAVAMPSILLVAVCSDMGAGFLLYNTFAGSFMNFVGNSIIAGAAGLLVSLHIVDWSKWNSKWQKAFSMLSLIYGAALGGIFKCRAYPHAPMVVILFHIPVVIGILRASALKQVNRASFYRSVGLATLLTGVGVLATWLIWMNVPAWDGVNRYNDATKEKLVSKSEGIYNEIRVSISGRSRSLDYDWDCKLKVPTDFDIVYSELVDNGVILTADEKTGREFACSEAKTIWFLVWIAPFITTMTNIVIAAFCLINGTFSGSDDMTKTETALKTFVSMVIVVFLCMWVAASIAGASMRLTGTIMAFCGAGLVALFLWIYLEVGTKQISTTLHKSKIMGQLIFVLTNDWFRACFLLGPGALLPAMFMIEVAKQKVRRLRGATTSTSWITPESENMLGFFRSWNWAAICVKANWLVILYWTLSIGVSKVTVVFLAFLNEEFEKNIAFEMVLVIFFCIGFAMFLLPPVPGIPVYITAGIIIAAQGRGIPGVGFGGGIGIAIALSLALKIVACCGQYAIGFFLGKSVKVQQMVGVDQVPTRAVEKILLRRGLGLGKVSVLVGGPDWPTSVMTGILRLNLFQCCLGTLPVVFVSSPCVLAGAFMAGPSGNMSDNQKSVWDALSNTMLAVSFVGQLASGVLAMYFIQDTIAKHSEELSQHRTEHERVKQLTLAEQDIRQCHDEVSDWRSLPKFWFRFIVLTTAMMIGAFFIFLMLDSVCFRDFQVNNKISDPEGLACDSFGCAVMRLVKFPTGYGALILFFMATGMHFVFVKYLKCRAKSRYSWKQENGLFGRTSRRSSVQVEANELLQKNMRVSQGKSEAGQQTGQREQQQQQLGFVSEDAACTTEM